MPKADTNDELSARDAAKSKKRYRQELHDLQVELVKLQKHFIHCDDKILVLIEGRDAAEVRGVVAGTHHVRWAPEAGGVFNPAFDVTPASLVTALVLDRAVVPAETLRADGLVSLA